MLAFGHVSFQRVMTGMKKSHPPQHILEFKLCDFQLLKPYDLLQNGRNISLKNNSELLSSLLSKADNGDILKQTLFSIEK